MKPPAEVLLAAIRSVLRNWPLDHRFAVAAVARMAAIDAMGELLDWPSLS